MSDIKKIDDTYYYHGYPFPSEGRAIEFKNWVRREWIKSTIFSLITAPILFGLILIWWSS